MDAFKYIELSQMWEEIKKYCEDRTLDDCYCGCIYSTNNGDGCMALNASSEEDVRECYKKLKEAK